MTNPFFEKPILNSPYAYPGVPLNDVRLLADGRDRVRQLDDARLLREVMNTVGKVGRLGESIRRVVSVSMLTKGWDANTVTQLLCEQVIGRALRRQSYDLNEEERFNVECADVLGIPFDFTAKPVVSKPAPPRETVQVRALRERDHLAHLAIAFPRVQGYRVELPEERLTAELTADSLLLRTPDLVGPSHTQNAGIVGETVDLSLAHLKDMRRSTLLMHLTKRLLYTRWRDANGEPRMHQELPDLACERITEAITRAEMGHKPIMAILDPYNPTGSTMHVNFSTSKPDFVVQVDDGRGAADPLNLVVEIKGYRGENAKDKKLAMETYWIPGVNRVGTHGRWAFAEFTDVWQLQVGRVQAGVAAALAALRAGLGLARHVQPGVRDAGLSAVRGVLSQLDGADLPEPGPGATRSPRSLSCRSGWTCAARR